ncbi:hypothetical protein FQR65_LT16252 [Abscondita terminalis]|nr:hypothetical protein FQR65_LT16252 [Abscondita terminalis]
MGRFFPFNERPEIEEIASCALYYQGLFTRIPSRTQTHCSMKGCLSSCKMVEYLDFWSNTNYRYTVFRYKLFTKMLSKIRVDKTNCCVYGCHTSRMKERNISFHLFPRKNSGFVYLTNNFGTKEKIDRRKAWEYILRMGKPTTKYMRVCGKHFVKEDYINEEAKKNIAPIRNYNEEVASDAQHDQPDLTVDNLNEEERIALDGLLNLQRKPLTEEKEPICKMDKEVQVTSGDLCKSYVSTIRSDKHLNSLTGITNFNLLEWLQRYSHLPRLLVYSHQDHNMN